MKTVEVSVDFIKEAHQSACANWKQRIEKELPDLFNKLEVGKWYSALWNDKDEYLVLIDEILYDVIKTNGFNISEKSEFKYLPFSVNYDYKWKLATEEEVKTALINEAVKRGFVSGKKVNPIWETPKMFWEVNEDDIRFYLEQNTLHFGCAIFQDGKWATLITEPTEKELLGDKIKDLEKNLEEVKSLYDKL